MRTIAAFSVALLATGCVPSVHTALYNITGSNDPYPMAFAPVIAEAYFREVTGESFYDRWGIDAYQTGTSGLCDDDKADDFINNKKPACWFIQLARDDTCTERELCVRYRLAPALQNDSMHRLVEKAVSSPCDHLSKDNGMPYSAYPSAIGESLSWSREILRCNDTPVQGYDVQFEPGGVYVRFLRTSPND